jgi:hypothetical protein
MHRGGAQAQGEEQDSGETTNRHASTIASPAVGGPDEAVMKACGFPEWA